MSKVDREVVASGDWADIECAVDLDGQTSPAKSLLDALAAGEWADPLATKLPDDRQVSLRRRLYALFESIAETGEFWPRDACRPLENGLWEFKVTNLRLTFYDTDGEGTWDNKIAETQFSWDGKKYWELPEDYDQFVRIGHHFPKTDDLASQSDLDEAFRLRDEDTNHDK